MFPDINALLDADLTGIDIELPEELGERAMEFAVMAAQLEAEVATYLYGPEATEEQFVEAVTILALYIKKRVMGMVNPENEE